MLKPATKLRPEDFGIQVWSPGQHPDSGKRHFYPNYIPRNSIDIHTYRTWNDDLGEELRNRRGFILLGEPLSGKSRTLFEIAKGMDGFIAVGPLRGGTVPDDDAFDVAVNGPKVLLVLDDLNAYIAVQTPLQEFAESLDRYSESWAVASACSNGPELG